MEATIFKNDDFVTVGIKIMHAGVKVFAWGANWEDGYYTKTINADKYMVQILDLIELDKMRRYYEDTFNGFRGAVFSVMADERNVAKLKSKKDRGIFFGEFDSKDKEIEAEIINIVKNIK